MNQLGTQFPNGMHDKWHSLARQGEYRELLNGFENYIHSKETVTSAQKHRYMQLLERVFSDKDNAALPKLEEHIYSTLYKKYHLMLCDASNGFSSNKDCADVVDIAATLFANQRKEHVLSTFGKIKNIGVLGGQAPIYYAESLPDDAMREAMHHGVAAAFAERRENTKQLMQKMTEASRAEIVERLAAQNIERRRQLEHEKDRQKPLPACPARVVPAEHEHGMHRSRVLDRSDLFSEGLAPGRVKQRALPSDKMRPTAETGDLFGGEYPPQPAVAQPVKLADAIPDANRGPISAEEVLRYREIGGTKLRAEIEQKRSNLAERMKPLIATQGQTDRDYGAELRDRIAQNIKAAKERNPGPLKRLLRLGRKNSDEGVSR